MFVVWKRHAEALEPNGYFVYTSLNIQKLHFLLVPFVSELCVDFRTNADWMADRQTDWLTDWGADSFTQFSEIVHVYVLQLSSLNL
jgi:hypothetical protein